MFIEVADTLNVSSPFADGASYFRTSCFPSIFSVSSNCCKGLKNGRWILIIRLRLLLLLHSSAQLKSHSFLTFLKGEDFSRTMQALNYLLKSGSSTQRGARAPNCSYTSRSFTFRSSIKDFNFTMYCSPVASLDCEQLTQQLQFLPDCNRSNVVQQLRVHPMCILLFERKEGKVTGLLCRVNLPSASFMGSTGGLGGESSDLRSSS
jgi:hypothetical protein